MSQLAMEMFPSIMQAGMNRSLAEVEDMRNLRHGQLMHITQNDRYAVLRVQTKHRLPDTAIGFVLDDSQLRGGRLIFQQMQGMQSAG